MATGEPVYQKRKHEFQRINIEEHNEQQDSVKDDGEIILEAIAPKEFVLIEPNDEQQRETDREGSKAAHRFHQFGEGFRNLERHHQQRYGKSKHCVAQAFDARDFVTAPAKFVHIADVFVD
jgi:hypothetical protein